MIKLSVIVPVYNMVSGGRLAFCLDSLVNQTLPDEDYEIIAVDDCSTDDSYALLRDYAARYPALFVVLKTPENLRQGGAKNLGLARARGEWIGFVDSDDFVAPSFYEKLLALAGKEGADMAGCDLYRTGVQAFLAAAPGSDDTQTKGTYTRIAGSLPEQAGDIDETKRRSLILDGGYLPPKIFKRYIVYGKHDPHVRVFPEKIFYEDNAAGPVWMTRVKRFAYLPEPLYYYYQTEASTTHTVTVDRLKDRMKAAKIMIAQAKRETPENAPPGQALAADAPPDALSAADAAGTVSAFDAYSQEFEYRFTQLFYVNTLFSAMQAKKLKDCFAFTGAVAKLMKREFPDFQKNPYYLARTPKEERELIAMQMRSQEAFYAYYRALWTYRRIRKRA